MNALEAEKDRVAGAIFDELEAAGLSSVQAAFGAQEARRHLRTEGVAELFVFAITDHQGAKHMTVTARRPPGPIVHRIDVLEHRRASRRITIANLKADLLLEEEGTEI